MDELHNFADPFGFSLPPHSLSRPPATTLSCAQETLCSSAALQRCALQHCRRSTPTKSDGCRHVATTLQRSTMLSPSLPRLVPSSRAHDRAASRTITPPAPQPTTKSWLPLTTLNSSQTQALQGGPGRGGGGASGGVFSVCLSGDGTTVVTGTASGVARVWTARTGALRLTLEGHTQCVNGVASSADASTIVTASADTTARVWCGLSGETKRILQGHTDVVWSVALTANADKVITGSKDSTTRVWSLLEDKHERILRGHEKYFHVTSVATSSDLILTGSTDTTARVWDLEAPDTGAEASSKLVLRGHTDVVWSVALSHDAKVAATGSSDRTARLWSVLTGEVLREMGGHTNWVRAVAVSANGRVCLTGSYDSTARVWIAGRRTAVVLPESQSAVLAVALSSDGMVAVTGSKDALAYVRRACAAVEQAALAMMGRSISSRAASPLVRRFFRDIDGDHAIWSRVVGFLAWST